jgi:hypothetical protein
MFFRFLEIRSWHALYGACVALAFVRLVPAQETSERTIQCNDPMQITSPVLISNVAVSDKTVECGLFIKPPAVVQPITPFQASDDWLQHMTISLVNRTQQVIDFATVSLMFLDNAVDCRTQVCPLEQIHLGQIPKLDAFNGRTGQPLKPEQVGATPLAWSPGQTIVVHVSDFMDEIGAKLPNYEPVGSVRKVAVHIGPFFFRDGMRWAGNRYSKPIPENPGKFNDLPETYFPGRRNSNWPPGYTQ